MSGSVKPRVMCRLSPNEEAALLRQQREDRRRARLLEVREQERSFAKKIRVNVQTKKQEERRAMEEQLQAVLAVSQEEELRELEAHYQARRKQIGQGHRQAQHVAQEENRLQEARIHLMAEQRWQAKQRHSAAMKELSINQLREVEETQHPVEVRKRALAVERERAKYIAVNKPHPTQPLIKDLAVGRGHKVQLKEADGFASTYYNIPLTVVQRVPVHHQGKPSAQEMAEATAKQDESFMKHSSVAQQEQQEKAWLRHKHALAKVKLEREKSDMMSQLRTLERVDRVHRQKSLAKMPVNMFQHTERRVELGCEQQRDMEQAFEGLFIKTHGVHSHPTLSQIGSTSGGKDVSPSPSDTSRSTTTQDSSSLTEPQHTSANKYLSQQHGGTGSQPPIKPSKYMFGGDRGSHDEDSSPRSQQPLAQAQGGKGDPSALSVTMLSSDYSSFQQKPSVLKPPPSSKASKLNSFPPRAPPGGPVTVPTGEMEPSEQSFESSSVTTPDEGAQDVTRSLPLFQHVEPPHLNQSACSTATASANQPPKIAELSVSDVTGSDSQELTSTTSKSTSSAGGNTSSGISSATGSAGVDGDGGDDVDDVGGSLRPPIKGILKRPAERNSHSSSVAASSAPSRRSEGVHKLVSVIRAQHQAWSERLAARASRLQSTISQMESKDSTPTASSPTSTSPAQLGQAGEDTQNPTPAPQDPAHDHFQEDMRAMHSHPPSLSAHQSEGGALHQQSHPSPPSLHTYVQEGERPTMHTQPSLSSRQVRGGALYQHSAEPSPPLSQDNEGRTLNQQHAPLSAGGVVRHNHPLPTLSGQGGVRGESELPPSLLPHGAGVKGDSQLVIPSRTSASHHDSLSIFTLSTRDSTRSPEPGIADFSRGSTERGGPTPEALSITQYHTTMDSLEPTAQQPSLTLQSSTQDNPLTDPRNSLPVQSYSPFATEYRITSPTGEPVGELTSSERADPLADVRVPPPSSAADLSTLLEPTATQSLQSGGTPASSTSLLISSMANTLGYGLHHTASSSMPHPLSPPSSSSWSATVPSSQPPTTLPLSSRSPFTLPNTAHPYSHSRASHIHHTHAQISNSLPPRSLGSPFSSLSPSTSVSLSSPLASLQLPLSGTPVVSTAAISAIPTPTAALQYHPLSSSHLLPPHSANSVSMPSDFHQLSFAAPLIHAMQDNTSSPSTPLSPHDHPPHTNIDDTSFELETPEHPHPLAHPHQLHDIVGEPAHYYHEASSELHVASMLQPPTPYGVNSDTTLQRLEANTDMPAQTQPFSEELSIFTLETSHAHSEQPIGAPSPSSSPSSLSSEKEQVAEEHSSSQSQGGTSDSDDSSCEEERESVDNIKHDASLDVDEEGGPKPELEGGARDSIQLHHPSLSPMVNDSSIRELEETESSESEDEVDLKARSELKQHHKGYPDSDSSEDSDSSSNPSQHDHFMPLPEVSPKSTQHPEANDDTQPHSPSLEDGSSESSLLDAPQGRSASPISLQEAFLKRKEQFILKSKHRLEQLKENAQKRQEESSPVLAHSTPRLTLHSKKPYKPLSPSNMHQDRRGHGLVTRSRGEQSSTMSRKQRDADARRRAVTFSSPLAIPQDTGKFTPPKFLGAVSISSTKPPQFLSSQKREKIRRKEMKERNLRFYNKLPEVKKQREEEQRKKAYSINRDKAKEYQQNLWIKVKNQGEKKQASSLQQATKTQTKTKLKRPPFR